MTPPDRVAIPAQPDEPRFIADAMLGRLARWLRTLGYDTAYDDAIADEDLVRRAFAEHRHILSRDRRLFEEWHVSGGLLVESDRVLDQLRQVIEVFDLPPAAHPFVRCRVCNTRLEPAAAADVRAHVPERVRVRCGAFLWCPTCARVYWEGSHTERMRSVLDQVFRRE